MTQNNQENESSSLKNILTKVREPFTLTKPAKAGESYLSDLSPIDKPWDNHRLSAEIVQSHYSNSDFNRYSERIEKCSRLLEFALNDIKNGDVNFRLKGASFCRVRFCTVCQWRRSLRWKAKAYEALPAVVTNYSGHRWLFLTLTVKSVPISDLRVELARMQYGFSKLVNYRNWPALGWLRSTEVTRSNKNNAHHHFHCLLLVDRNYFGRRYIKHEEWCKMWRKAMKLDYHPQVNVKAISDKKDAAIIIPEMLKYCTKEFDLLADREWLIELTRQLHKTRAVATGGVLKKYFAELEKEPEDLIGNDDESEGDELGDLQFNWETKIKKYKLVE